MILPELPSTVILNVGYDPTLLDTRCMLLRAVGYIVEPASSIEEAIHRFRSGDFDLVVLCHSVREEDRDRLIGWIRDSGSSTPVITVATGAGEFLHDGAGHRTVGSDPGRLLRGISEALEKERFRRRG